MSRAVVLSCASLRHCGSLGYWCTQRGFVAVHMLGGERWCGGAGDEEGASASLVLMAS